MYKHFYIVLFLAACVLSSACSDNNALCCKSGTKVNLKDSCTLTLGIEFRFDNEKNMREFKYKEKEIMFALRLALRDHNSSMLRGMGKRNVINAIKSISKQVLHKKIARVKIVEYNFSDRKASS